MRTPKGFAVILRVVVAPDAALVQVIPQLREAIALVKSVEGAQVELVMDYRPGEGSFELIPWLSREILDRFDRLVLVTVRCTVAERGLLSDERFESGEINWEEVRIGTKADSAL